MKIAKAMGCEVTVLSTSEKKREEAIKILGADHFVISRDEADMKVKTYSSTRSDKLEFGRNLCINSEFQSYIVFLGLGFLPIPGASESIEMLRVI